MALLEKTFSKYIFKIALLKNTFLKLLPQRIHSQNQSLKNYFFQKNTLLKMLPEKYILKIAPSKNTASKFSS